MLSMCVQQTLTPTRLLSHSLTYIGSGQDLEDTVLTRTMSLAWSFESGDKLGAIEWEMVESTEVNAIELSIADKQKALGAESVAYPPPIAPSVAWKDQRAPVPGFLSAETRNCLKYPSLVLHMPKPHAYFFPLGCANREQLYQMTYEQSRLHSLQLESEHQ